MVVFLAISGAFFIALSSTVVRIGLRNSNVISAGLMSMLSCLAVTAIISLFTIPLELFAARGVWCFIAAGFIGAFLARWLFFIGIDRVGASIASPLNETKPLYATIGALVLLGEQLTLSIASGTLLIIAGATTISAEESGGHIEKQWSKKDLIYPLLAGPCFGVAQVLRKMGLNIIPEPILGLTVQNAVSVVLYLLVALAQRNRQRVTVNDKRSWLIFGLAGFLIALSQLCIFSALKSGEVILVSPLSSLGPFFVLLLVGIFLRKVERVTWKIVMGSVLIVGGTAVLTLL